jgi:hypothetical protein
MRTILVKVIDKKHRMCQERQAEGGVGGSQLLVCDYGGSGVQPRAPVLGVDSYAQDSQLTETLEEREVELLLPVELERLGVHLVLYEGT